MRARTVLVVTCVLVLAGGAWWWLGVAREAPDPRPDDPEPTSPSATPSATPKEEPEPPGRPVAACAPERLGGTLPRSYWGMHVTEPIGPGFPDAPIGALNLTTSGTFWDQVETAPGQYDFSRLDSIVETSEGRGAQPMVVIGFTPDFHSTAPASDDPRTTMPDLAAWRAWVTAVVERYGPRVDYQVWPEPNIVTNWTGTPEQMAQLTAVAGRIISDRAARARVVAPAVALRLPSQQRWTERFWATEVDGRPVGQFVDAAALDPFPLSDGTPEDALDLICHARQIMADHGPEVPVWTNEINYGVAGGGATEGVPTYDDELQAAVVARTYLLHAALGVERVYWLGWFTVPTMAVGMAREDGSTAPAGTAFAVVERWLAGGSRPDCRVARGTHTCVVDRGRDELRVHWRERGTATVRAGEGARWIQPLLGERRSATSRTRVEVGQSPVAVVAATG